MERPNWRPFSAGIFRFDDSGATPGAARAARYGACSTIQAKWPICRCKSASARERWRRLPGGLGLLDHRVGVHRDLGRRDRGPWREIAGDVVELLAAIETGDD